MVLNGFCSALFVDNWKLLRMVKKPVNYLDFSKSYELKTVERSAILNFNNKGKTSKFLIDLYQMG